MSWKKIGENKYRRELEKTIDGERYRISRTVETKLKGLQLKAFLNQKENEYLNELKLKANDKNLIAEMNIVELCNWHISNADIEQNTIDSYKRYIKRPAEFFKSKPASSINEKDIKLFFKSLDKEISKSTKKPLSAKTKKNYKTYLHSLFNVLVEKELIEKNPCRNISIYVQKQTVKDKFYSPDEIKECVDKLSKYSTTKYTLTFVLCVLGGLRPSEIQGLKWGKLTLSKKEMLIDTALVKTDIGYIEKCTKNEEIRTISLPGIAISLLRVHLEDEKIKRTKLNIKTSLQDSYIFTNDNYQHVGESTFRDYWRNFCERHNIRYVCPYGLRHTTATILALNKFSIRAIANQMGHRCLETTGIYIHVVEEERKEISSVLENAIGNKIISIG